MKFLFRTLIVVVVIGLLAGVIYWIFENNSSVLLSGIRTEGGAQNLQGFHGGQNSTDFTGQFPPDGGGHGLDRDRGGSAGGWVELGLNLFKVALITIGVALLNWIIRVVRRRRNLTHPAD